MFVAFTVTKTENAAGKTTEAGGIRVRMRWDLIDYFQEFGKECIIYTKSHGKFYVKESVEELDAIFKGANPVTSGLLYGKE